MITSSPDVGYFTGSIVYEPAYSSTPLTIDIGSGPDSNNIAWIWQKIDGWDSPDVFGQITQRSADHGGWPTSQYYAPRIITLTVYASAPDQATRDLARALFQQAVPINDLALLTYNEPIPKQVEFRRTGKVAESYPTLTDVIFTCNLIMPDPRKYSTTQHNQTTVVLNGLGADLPNSIPLTIPDQTAPGSILAFNAGTFEVRPLITVQGPCTAPALWNVASGKQVSFSQLTLQTGDLLVVDFDARAATVNGAYRAADIMSAWWVLDPGYSTIQLTGSGGSMMVTWRDGWI